MHRLAIAAVVLASMAALPGCSTTGSHPRPMTSVPPSPASHLTATGVPKPRLAPSPNRAPVPVAPPSRSPTATTLTRYVFPVQGCPVFYGRSHHDYPATDIFAARGCLVVAPVAGRVDEVSTADRWNPRTNNGADRGGLSISIVGADGVRYYGSHLSTILDGVRPGVRLQQGEPLGRVGNSGDARGIATHLHFGISWPTAPDIWWLRRGEIYPWPYLDAWRGGHNVSPAAAVAAARATAGSIAPACRVDC